MIDFLIVNHKYLDDEHTMSWIVDGPYPGSSVVSIDCRIESMKNTIVPLGHALVLKSLFIKLPLNLLKGWGIC